MSNAFDTSSKGLEMVSEASDTYYDFKRMFPPSE